MIWWEVICNSGLERSDGIHLWFFSWHNNRERKLVNSLFMNWKLCFYTAYSELCTTNARHAGISCNYNIFSWRFNPDLYLFTNLHDFPGINHKLTDISILTRIPFQISSDSDVIIWHEPVGLLLTRSVGRSMRTRHELLKKAMLLTDVPRTIQDSTWTIKSQLKWKRQDVPENETQSSHGFSLMLLIYSTPV